MTARRKASRARAVTGTELVHDPSAELLDDALGGCGHPDCQATPEAECDAHADCRTCQHRPASLPFGRWA